MSGELVRLDGDGQINRRTFLRNLAAAGTGVAAINSAVQSVYGKKPDGVPLVYTYDTQGNPRKVRYIPEERYRRIKLLDKINVENTFRNSERVTGMTLEETSDPRKPRLKIFLDRNNRTVRKGFPSHVKRVPVVFEERKLDPTYKCRQDLRVGTMEGNIEIGTSMTSNGAVYEGTLGVVGTSQSRYDYHAYAITAWHVMEPNREELRQPGMSTSGGNRDSDSRVVGDYNTHSSRSEYDLVAYELSGVDYDLGGTHSDQQAEIEGVWTADGLWDQIYWGSNVEVDFAGARTCNASTECVGVSNDAELNHTAYFDPVVTIKGDSGGPFVDQNGNLVAMLSGENNGMDFGPVAKEGLDSIYKEVGHRTL